VKVVDVHIHVFPEDVADAYMEDYSMHSGMHAHCKPTLDALFKSYEGVEVRNYVILQEWQSSTPFESPNLKYIGRCDSYYTEYFFYSFNRWLGQVQAGNDKLLCFGGVHPDEDDPEDEFARMVNDYALRGMKLVPCMQQFFLNDRRLFPVYERAAAYGLPVLVHTGGDPIQGMELYGHPRDVEEIASAFPNLTIIIAHVGIPFFGEAKDLMSKHENVFTDISFTIEVIDRKTVSSLIREVGLDRVMFGSDFPFVQPKDAIRKVLELDVSDSDKERILWRNAVEILKLP
jgi:predicted TIM-barrel fold metal-dependent hydrolase